MPFAAPTPLCARAGARAALLSFFTLFALGGCRPFAALGESCEDAPCAVGLVCSDAVCAEPPPLAAAPLECEGDGDCAVAGSADGRACVEGRCAWEACSFDGQCGARVCDLGTCAERERCGDDDDDDGCGEGRICEDDACRTACVNDDQCGGLAACDEGRCRQQCFFDLMCFGELCQDGLCQPPECEEDDDCSEDGASYFCDGGRCISFVPCGQDGDCFDPDFRCNELGRCEARPLCRVDAECGGQALCLGGRCRPTDSCSVTGECDDDEECLAGRCVARLGCRADADCAAEEACTQGACAPAPGAQAAALVLGAPLGACEAGGAGACALILAPGEAVFVQGAAFAEDGAPVRADVDLAAFSTGIVEVTPAGPRRWRVTATAPGASSLLAAAGDVRHEALEIVVLPPVAAGLEVLVVEASTGRPVEGAMVTAGVAEAATGSDGLARFAELAPGGGELFVGVREGARGLALLGAPAAGLLRFVLPKAPSAATAAAGFTAQVSSSGDETGAVGLGLALPGVARLEDAGLLTLLGPAFRGALEVPLLGAQPVDLPAAATLEASLPLVGAQVVRASAFAATSEGRRGVLAYEGRFDQSELFALIGGAESVGLALDLAVRAEGMDALVGHAGALVAMPLVVDGDLGDGLLDVDGDGDVEELVPDFASFPVLSLTPARLPRERVGIVVGGLPAAARARAFVAAGVTLPGYGFSPLGIGAITPPADGEQETQLKVQPPTSAGLSAGERALMVEAIFDEPGLSSRLFFRGPAFGPALPVGRFLAPPEGAFVLDGLPAPGERLLVLPGAPGATTYRVWLEGEGVRWALVTAADEGGRSVVLPQALAGRALVASEALRLPGVGAAEATAVPFSPGSGPTLLDAVATAVARAAVR